MMIIENKFEIGDFLFLKTDKDQERRVCTAIKICPDNSLLYEVICGTISSYHYEFELTSEEDIQIKIK